MVNLFECIVVLSTFFRLSEAFVTPRCYAEGLSSISCTSVKKVSLSFLPRSTPLRPLYTSSTDDQQELIAMQVSNSGGDNGNQKSTGSDENKDSMWNMIGIAAVVRDLIPQS